MSNGSQALRKSAKLGIGLTRLFGALGAVFRVRSPQRPHDTESSGLRGTSQFSLLKRMRKVPKFVVFLGLVLVVVLASAMVRAFALSGGCATPTITWIGNANQGPDSWHTASNWQDNLGANRVPGAGDHVCISSAANTDSIAYSTGTTSVASLESEEALTISGGTLELTSATEESKVNNLTLSGSGTLSGAGNLTIPAGGNATWSGGTMTGAGKTLISAANDSSPAAATLSITGSSSKVLNGGRVLENAGTTTFSGAFIDSGTGAVIENSGTFDIRGDGGIRYNFGGTKTRQATIGSGALTGLTPPSTSMVRARIPLGRPPARRR
jgi:hypothetical protein